MKFLGSRSLVVVIAVAVLILFLQDSFYLANIVVHTIIDLFAGGRSLIKVELFFLYLILLCLLVFISPVRNFLAKFTVRTKLVFALLGVSFTYGLFLFVLFYNKFGFWFKDFVLVFNNGEISSTMLLHNHLMKGINGNFLSWFGLASQENVDTGLAFVNLLHPAFYMVGATLVLITTITLILKFVELYNEQVKRQWLLVVIYAISSFSLIKNMLDGGVLNREAPVSLAALSFILIAAYNHNKDNEDKISYLRSLWALVGYGLVILLLWALDLIPIGAFTSTVIPILSYVVVIASLIFANFFFQSKKKLTIGLLVIALAMLINPIYQSTNTFLKSQQAIADSGVYVGLYSDPKESNSERTKWNFVSTVNQLKVYEAVPLQRTTYKDILRENNLLGNLTPIRSPNYNCNLQSSGQKIEFILMTRDKFTNIVSLNPLAKISETKKLSSFNGVDQYKVTILTHPCMPRLLNVVGELLKERGLNTFFLTNIYLGNSNKAVGEPGE